jgi:hypothetical protein
VGIKEFDFSTPGDWTLLGDGEIASSKFSLESGKTVLYWNTHNWSTVPTMDGNGDRQIAGTPALYRITDDGTAYDLADYAFVFTLKRLSGTLGSHFRVYHHWTQAATPERIQSKFYCPTSYNMRWYIYHSDSALRTQDQMYALAAFGTWPEGVFRTVSMLFRGDSLKMTVSSGAIGDHATSDLDMDDTDGGDIAIDVLYGSNLKWIMGDGQFGTQPTPYLCQRKRGGVQLKVGSAWDLSNVTALGRMMAVGDLTGGGDIPLPVDLRYNHYDGSNWTGWIAPAADGDISALSCGAGKKLLVGITDGSTGGMDTMCDTAFANHQAEYAPVIDRVLVTCTEPSTTNIGLRSTGYTGGPNRGERE